MAEVGTNWNIRRGIADPQLVQIAGFQALALSVVRTEFITDFEVGHDEHSKGDLTVSLVDLSHPEARSFMTGYPELMEMYAITELSTRNGLGSFFINCYGARASTPRHRDNYPGAVATSAIGLLGEAETEIDDPLTGLQTERVYAGDEWWLDNTVPMNQRPLHIVRNVLDTPRVAIANG